MQDVGDQPDAEALVAQRWNSEKKARQVITLKLDLATNRSSHGVDDPTSGTFTFSLQEIELNIQANNQDLGRVSLWDGTKLKDADEVIAEIGALYNDLPEIPEEKEESTSSLSWVKIAIAAAILVAGGFLVWKQAS